MTAPKIIHSPRRAAIPREALLALSGAILIAGGLIAAAMVVTREQRPDPAAAKGTADDRAALDEEQQKKLEQERHALEQEQRKLQILQLLSRAKLMQADRRYAEAEKLYAEVLRLAPGDSDAVKGLVDVRVALAADTRVREERVARETDYARLMSQGKDALGKKQYVVAARSFTVAGQVRPGDADAAAALADVAQAQAAEQLAKRQLGDYQAHLDGGKAALAGKRYQEAVQEFLAAQRVNATDEVAVELKQAQGRLNDQQEREKRQAQYAGLMERAKFAMRNRHYDAAMEAIESALKLFPEDREAQQSLHEAKKAKKESRSEFNKLMAQGNAALQNQQIEEATRAFTAAAALFPEDAGAARMVKQLDHLLEGVQTNQAAYLRFVTRGAVALRAGLYADAVRAYTEALRLAPNDPEALLGLREAQINLNGAVVLGADYDRLMALAGQALAQQQWSDAAKAYSDALRLAPNDPAATAGLRQARYQQAMARGRAAMLTRRYVDAVRFFQAALTEAPGDFPALNALRQAQALRR